MKAYFFGCYLPILLTQIVYAQEIPGRFTEATTKQLQASDIKDYDSKTLKLMRNEIFARYGYIFKNEELKIYFGGQSWYKPLKADVTNQLTEIEKVNIALIKAQEDRIAKTSEFDSFYSLFSKSILSDDFTLFSFLAPGKVESTTDLKNSYDYHKDAIREAMKDGTVTEPYTGTKQLRFGEYYEGVQYSWVEFQKQGCCWVIIGIMKAG